MRFRLPPLRGNGRATRRALRLQQAQGAPASSGGPVNDTATTGRDTDEHDSVWYLPAGAARGERNRHRARGWAIAVGVALLGWGVIAGIVVLVVSLLR